MIKKLFPFLSVIMLALFVGACSSEDVMPNIDQGASSRTVTFEASMPGEDDPATRVSVAEEADRTIDLKWETNDKIVLLFVQGETKKSATATVVSADGETGTFTVTLPDGIEATDYMLYGAYGTAGAPAEGNTTVNLPSTGDLGDKILLHFKQEVTGNAIGSVEFAHKGYVFTAKVEITGSNDITDISLVGNEAWALGSSDYTFDLESGNFTTTATATNSISLENFVVKDGVATARSWFPALGNKIPALKLNVNGTAVTTEAKPAKTPVAGEAYYLYAKYDGTDLVFDDKGTKENPYTVAEAIGAQGRTNVWVKGFIVGSYNNGSIFGIENASEYNLNIADDKDATTDADVVNVQLPGGTGDDNMRHLSLDVNPGMYKAEILFRGNLEKYNSLPGIKNTKEYEIISAGESFLISDVTELYFQADGDALTQTIEITTLDTETWSVASNASWLTVTPENETGSSSIEVTASENTAETERTATVTITPTANADLTPIVVNVTQAGTVTAPEELLFPGSDFNNWAEFTSALNKYGVKFGKESKTGGREGSGAMHIDGTPTGNDYVFTAVVPEGFSAVGRTMIHFWIKGTAAKSLSLNVYTGSGYKPYNLGSATADVVLEPKASNSYTGNVNTNGEWIQVTLDISSIVSKINSTPGDDLFALKVGKDAVYDILVDDITIE